MKHLLFYSAMVLALITRAQDYYPTELVYDPAEVPTAGWTAGNFELTWDAFTGQFTVRYAGEARILWSSIPGEGFATGAVAEAHIEEDRGFFTIDDEKQALLHQQEILAIGQQGDTVSIDGLLHGDAMSVPYTLRFYPAASHQLTADLSIQAPVNRGYLTYTMDDAAGIFGFGAQCSHFNHRGNRVPVLVQEQGIGRGDLTNPLINLVLGTATGDDYTSYISVPQYSTSDGNSLFLENYEISSFDFREQDAAQIEVFSNHLKARILYGNSPADLIEEYTSYTGRMRPLPDWAISGAIIGLQGGTEKLYNVWSMLEAAETPIAAFWIQDWVGQRTTVVGRQLWWNWELEEPRYPDFDQLRDSLAQAGISLMSYINPFLVNVYQQKPYRRNQYVEGFTNGFLVKREDGYPYQVAQTSFSSAIIDLSNPSTRRWIKDIIIDEMIARGFRGWMADFGEALPFDVFLEDADPSTYHNAFAEEWAALNMEAIAEAGFEDDIVYFSRSGYTRSPGASTLFWMGDQMVNWEANDGIKSSVTGLLSSGMSGFSLNHSDIGGYATINFAPFVPVLSRSADLLRRWTEMNAFTAVFRTHEGLGPEINAQIYSDEAAVAHFAKWAKVYKAWFFYRKQLVAEAAATGMPVVRHPFLHFPDDPEVQELSYQQFMLGDQFMVAPVLDQGSTSIDIYLPAGEWVNLWTGETVSSPGTYYNIGDLTDRPAVFYVNGSAVAAAFIQNMIDLGVYE